MGVLGRNYGTYVLQPAWLQNIGIGKHRNHPKSGSYLLYICVMVPKASFEGAMVALSECVVNYLFNGHSVEFPNLGIFFLTCESTTTVETDEAGLKQFGKFKIRFRPCKELAQELERVECELDGVYKVIGERVLERDGNGTPTRTEKIYSKVKGGEDELLYEDDLNNGDNSSTIPDDGGSNGTDPNPDDGGFAG